MSQAIFVLLEVYLISREEIAESKSKCIHSFLTVAKFLSIAVVSSYILTNNVWEWRQLHQHYQQNIYSSFWILFNIPILSRVKMKFTYLNISKLCVSVYDCRSIHAICPFFYQVFKIFFSHLLTLYWWHMLQIFSSGFPLGFWFCLWCIFFHANF